MEFIYRNLNVLSTIYFYRVTEFVTTFEKDEGKHKPFTHMEEFRGDDLLKCKHEAERYYYERLAGMPFTQYHLPFHEPEGFEYGKHAAFTLELCLVGYEPYSDSDIEHPLLGCEEEEMIESRELEDWLLRIQFLKDGVQKASRS